MSNLRTRIISAVIAVSLLLITVYFFELRGVLFLSFLVAIIGCYEMAQLIFSTRFPKFSKTLFVSISAVSFIVLYPVRMIPHAFLLFPACLLLVGALSIIFHKQFSKIEDIFSYVAKFILGLMYALGFPIMIVWILQAPQGMIWFLCLLAVIFSGDIGAYLFGTLFGKTKLAPLLSPKKSLQGSLGGLLFSSSAAAVFSLFLPAASLGFLLVLGLLGGLFGQIGDFFESLIKRIAGVKDSGSIMPGHGGVLDRLDGVYFASPLFYVTVYYIIG